MSTSIKIGRDNTNDIAINEPRVSRNHAIITDIGNGKYEIKDLGSTNGTFVNGSRITQKIIRESDKVEVGGSLVNWFAAFANPQVKQQQSIIEEQAFYKIQKTISIGSSTKNDIVIPDNFVSNQHAKISLLKNGSYFIQDLGSSNGTFVNGAKIQSKNFTKTDVVKLATSDLPDKWFENKNLKKRFFSDNKKTIFLSFLMIIIIAGAALSYLNCCKWYGCGCNKSIETIMKDNKNSIVYIEHDYFYTIEANGKTYFVGKNKEFGGTEANTSKENLKPYGKVIGCGCFISNDGKIITSPLIANPWINQTEQKIMLNEVIESRTIDNFSLKRQYKTYGETADLKFLPNGQINNTQNYLSAVDAVITKDFILTDSSNVIIQSVKKTLPDKATFLDYHYDKKAKEQMHKTKKYYYGSIILPVSTIKDTFYMVKDSSLDINKVPSVPLNKSLPPTYEGSIVLEGSPVLNERGELIGLIRQKQLVFLNKFVADQIKK